MNICDFALALGVCSFDDRSSYSEVSLLINEACNSHVHWNVDMIYNYLSESIREYVKKTADSGMSEFTVEQIEIYIYSYCYFVH